MRRAFRSPDTAWPGAIFDSMRRLRTAVTRPCRNSISRSASALSHAFFAFGHGACASVSPSWGIACHSSSLTNGMNGCIRRSVPSSTFHETQRAVFKSTRSFGVIWSPLSASAQRGLAISRYQSQYSFHAKW